MNGPEEPVHWSLTDDAQVVVALMAGPQTTSELVGRTGLTMRQVLLSVRGLLNRGDAVAAAGARYTLNEVRNDRQATADEIRG